MRASLLFFTSALALALAAAPACSRTTLVDPPSGAGGEGGAPSTSTTASTTTSASTSTSTSTGIGGAPGVCGDGVLDPGEQCDDGAANADRPALALLQGALFKGVRPLDNPASAALFYSYSSASGHTGLEKLDTSRVFFYRNTASGALSLFFLHGIDLDSSGEDQPAAHVIMDATGLPFGAFVSVADDTFSEFASSSLSAVHGNWTFNHNSDGGVISNFPFPGTWKVTVTPTSFAGITGWEHVDGDGSTSVTALQPTQPIVLQAFDMPSACRTSCTVPACGDGILDGGEVCDDGNTVGSDGCAANCKSLQ